MKYEIGDSIIVKLTNEEGKVIDILNEQMVLIDVKGVKFPAYMDQIDFPYFNMFSKQQKEAPKPEKKYIDDVKREKPTPIAKKEKIHTGVWINLIPILSTDDFGDDIIEFFKIYLINETEHLLLFDYDLLLNGEINFSLKNELLPFHNFYVHDVAIESFSNNPKFNFIFSLKNPHKTKAEFYETHYKIKGKQIFQQLSLMKETGEASIRHKLLDQYPNATVTEKLDLSKLTNAGLKIIDAKAYTSQLPTARTVIDIHIEKLVHDHTHLTNAEILDIQMKEFEKWYNIAVLKNQPFFIVVHGVGNGVLRNEVHEFLKYKKEVKSFVNQYHPSFGYGATEIQFNT
jgi:Smr domain